MRSVLESFVSAAPRASSKTVACRRVVMQAHDGGPMRTLFLLLLAPLLIASLAQADPDDLSGGVLLVHAPPSLTYTASASWCDSTHLDDCEDQVTSIPTDSSKTVVWFILSAWAEEKSFTAVEFGLGDFDEESFLFSESGLCLDHAMALYHGDWPGPNTGVAIATNTEPWMGQLVPIFWAAGVNYAAADTIAITENPATGHAGWASESRESFDAECLGALGLGIDGQPCCSQTASCCWLLDCLVLTADSCLALGGIWHPDAPSCDHDPDPCDQLDPPPVICCHEDGQCARISVGDCRALGGTIIWDASSCDPQPCPNATLELRDWGTVKRLFRLERDLEVLPPSR